MDRYESKLFFQFWTLRFVDPRTTTSFNSVETQYLKECVTGGEISAIRDRMIGESLISNCPDTLSRINEALFTIKYKPAFTANM